MRRFIKISFLSNEKLDKETYGRPLLSLFYNEFPKLVPEYASFTDPVNNPIPTIDKALKYWENNFGIHHFIGRRKHSVKGDWSIGKGKTKIAFIKFEYNWNNKIDWLDVFKKIQNCVKAYFGYLHFFTEPEKELGYKKGVNLYCDFRNGATGWKIEKKGIPDLGWATYFGEKYTRDLPIEKIKSEGANITPQNNGHIITLSDNISSIIKEFPELDDRRDRVKSHFPEGFFQKYTND